MAAVENPVAATGTPIVSVAVGQDAQQQLAAPSTPGPSSSLVAAVTAAAASTPTPSVASPASAVSPRQSIPTTPLGIYPAPLATHDQVIADEQLFMETFYRFHTVLKSRPSIPKMGGKDLDVHLLYKEVSSRGGLNAVIRDRKWKEITTVFDLPRTTTSASYVLRKYYITLLFHYEQVYRNGATGPLLTPPALSGSSPSVQHGDSALSEGAEQPVRKRIRKRRLQQPQLPTVDPAEAIGTTVMGAIDGKLDFGYLVTMVVGGEKLKGILYHVPPGNRGPQFASLPGLLNSMNNEMIGAGGETHTRRKRRRKEEMPRKDPNAPRPNRTGYNFFFAEQRQRLKLLHPDKDREISRMIGEAWNALTDEQKGPYQERGVKDKERFNREIQEYREKQNSGFFNNSANGQGKAQDGAVSSEKPIVPDPGQATATTVQTVAANSGNAVVVLEQLSTEQKPISSQVAAQ